MLIRIHQTQKFKTFTCTSSLNCNKRGLYSFGPTLLKPVSALKKKKTKGTPFNLKLVWDYMYSLFLVSTSGQKKSQKDLLSLLPSSFAFLLQFLPFNIAGKLLICISAWDVSLKFQGIVGVSWRKHGWDLEQDFHSNFLTGHLYIDGV